MSESANAAKAARGKLRMEKGSSITFVATVFYPGAAPGALIQRKCERAAASKADMCGAKGHVRSTPESGHVRCN